MLFLETISAVEIKAIILDDGKRQAQAPGDIPVKQLNYIFNRNVPCYAGLHKKLSFPTDPVLDDDIQYQQGVNTILNLLRTSKEKVTLITVGSVTNIMAAFNRDEKLFRDKVERIFCFLGDASVEHQNYPDYNISLDKNAFVRLFSSDLPVYWVPCFDGGIWTNNGRASFWQAKHSELWAGAPKPVLNYFLYALSHQDSDPIKFLQGGVDKKMLLEKGQQLRNLWCSAVFTYIASRPNQNVFDFVPVEVIVNSEGKLISHRLCWPQESNVMRFAVLDKSRYQTVMTDLTNRLIRGRPGLSRNMSDNRSVITRFDKVGKTGANMGTINGETNNHTNQEEKQEN